MMLGARSTEEGKPPVKLSLLKVRSGILVEAIMRRVTIVEIGCAMLKELKLGEQVSR